MNAQARANHINALIVQRDIAGRRTHTIRANDFQWSRPIACVKVEIDERTLTAVDVYGACVEAHTFFDTDGKEISETSCVVSGDVV